MTEDDWLIVSELASQISRHSVELCQAADLKDPVAARRASDNLRCRGVAVSALTEIEAEKDAKE